MHFFLEALGENVYFCLSQLLEAALIPCVTVPFHPQSQQRSVESFSHHITLTPALLPPVPHFRALVIALSPSSFLMTSECLFTPLLDFCICSVHLGEVSAHIFCPFKKLVCLCVFFYYCILRIYILDANTLIRSAILESFPPRQGLSILL